MKIDIEHIPLLPTERFEVLWPCLGVLLVRDDTTVTFELDDVPG